MHSASRRGLDIGAPHWHLPRFAHRAVVVDPQSAQRRGRPGALDRPPTLRRSQSLWTRANCQIVARGISRCTAPPGDHSCAAAMTFAAMRSKAEAAASAGTAKVNSYRDRSSSGASAAPGVASSGPRSVPPPPPGASTRGLPPPVHGSPSLPSRTASPRAPIASTERGVFVGMSEGDKQQFFGLLDQVRPSRQRI